MTLEITQDQTANDLCSLDRSLRRLTSNGLLFIALFVAGFAVWSVAVVLVGAVAATGQFVVSGDVKKVQHMTGGVVGELLVREGDKVTAGQVVLKLDPTMTEANRQIISNQLDEMSIRQTRLEAERDGLDTLSIPVRLASRIGDRDVAKIIESERHLLTIRRQAMDGRKAQLNKQITQLRDEIVGLEAQLNAAKSEDKILVKELRSVRELFAKKLVPYIRLSQLEREAARVEGRTGQITSQIAETNGKVSETQLQLIQLDDDAREKAMTELREIDGRRGEFASRLVAADDQLKRVDLRAPASGVVHQLATHTVGGVLAPGETAMLIVPTGEELQVEARIAPSDIDQVMVGQPVRLKLRAGNQRTMPELVGHTAVVSADISTDERTGAAFYTVRIVPAPGEIEKVAPLKIIAGMQAEVFVETTARTPIDFLLKPLTDQIARTFRER